MPSCGKLDKLAEEAVLDRQDVPRVRRTGGTFVEPSVRQLGKRRRKRDTGASPGGLLRRRENPLPLSLDASEVRGKADEAGFGGEAGPRNWGVLRIIPVGWT